MNRIERQKRIKKIMKQHLVETQEELMELLQNEGIHVTQATISRDMRQLKVVKAADGKQSYYTIFQEEEETDEEKLARILKNSVVSMEQVAFICLLRTHPNEAHVVAAIFDKIKFSLIEATIGSFDTVLLVSPGVEEAKKIMKHMKQLQHSDDLK